MNVCDALKASPHGIATRNPEKSYQSRYARMLEDGRFQTRPDYGDKWKVYPPGAKDLYDDWEPYCQWVVMEECTEDDEATIWAGWDMSHPWEYAQMFTSYTYFDTEEKAKEYFLDVCVQLRPGELRDSFKDWSTVRPKEGA